MSDNTILMQYLAERKYQRVRAKKIAAHAWEAACKATKENILHKLKRYDLGGWDDDDGGHFTEHWHEIILI